MASVKRLPVGRASHVVARLAILQGLKNHAVTMFEVGKLSDETMDSFLGELDKVSRVLVHVCRKIQHKLVTGVSVQN